MILFEAAGLHKLVGCLARAPKRIVIDRGEFEPVQIMRVALERQLVAVVSLAVGHGSILALFVAEHIF